MNHIHRQAALSLLKSGHSVTAATVQGGWRGRPDAPRGASGIWLVGGVCLVVLGGALNLAILTSFPALDSCLLSGRGQAAKLRALLHAVLLG